MTHPTSPPTRAFSLEHTMFYIWQFFTKQVIARFFKAAGWQFQIPGFGKALHLGLDGASANFPTEKLAQCRPRQGAALPERSLHMKDLFAAVVLTAAAAAIGIFAGTASASQALQPPSAAEIEAESTWVRRDLAAAQVCCGSAWEMQGAVLNCFKEFKE